MSSPSESAATTTRLRLTNVAKQFGDIEVLRDVTTTLAAAEVMAITGGNGSGKTTLLNGIAGLTRCTGTIELDGVAISDRRTGHPAIGYLPQAPGLPDWATGNEILRLFCALRGVARLPDHLDTAMLPPLDRPIRTLSGGMRQRLALAVSLLGRPRLLLLDEPSASLDDAGIEALAIAVEKLRATGTSIVITAPTSAVVTIHADRTAQLVDGMILPDTGPDDRQRHPSSLRAVPDLPRRQLRIAEGAR